MIRGRLLRMFVWVLIFSSDISTAQSPTDTTVDAKQHYQTAMAAAAKEDWQKARTELQLAVALASSNALLHYDLALAYSHTNQISKARAEVKLAISLGLPATQIQAAQDLRKTLDARSDAKAHAAAPEKKEDIQQIWLRCTAMNTIHENEVANKDDSVDDSFVARFSWLPDRQESIDKVFVWQPSVPKIYLYDDKHRLIDGGGYGSGSWFHVSDDLITVFNGERWWGHNILHSQFTETIDRQTLKYRRRVREELTWGRTHNEDAEGTCLVIQALPLDFKTAI